MYREKDSEILAEAEIALPLALKCGGLRRAKAQKMSNVPRKSPLARLLSDHNDAHRMCGTRNGSKREIKIAAGTLGPRGKEG